MKACFIAAGPVEWASSRMRAYWVAECRDEWTAVQFGESLPVADSYIWQKSVSLEMVTGDARHYWDVCDPLWWWKPKESREVADKMTAVIASSKSLAEDFNKWYGVNLACCIPDRLKLEHFTKQRQHVNTSPVRFIWFGIAANRLALYGAIANLERLSANGHKIELTIFDDRPDMQTFISDMFPVYYTRWQLSNEVDILAGHDVALLPPYPGAWGRVKSDNKALTAWACGLPVWKGLEYETGESLMDKGYRQWSAKVGRETVEHDYTVDKSAGEWEALLCG